MVRVILISDTYPPITNSAAIQLGHLANKFVDSGHDLTVVTADPSLNAFSRIEYQSGYVLVRVRVPKMKDVPYWRRTLAEAVMPLLLYFGVRKRVGIRSKQWDLLVWYSPSIFLSILVWLIKIRVMCKSYLILRDLFPKWALDAGLIKPGFVYKCFDLVSELQFRVADRVGVQSTGDLRIVSEKNRLFKCKYEVLPNWLGETTASPCSINLEQTILRGRRVFVYAGNMGKAQVLDTFVELADRLQEQQDLGFLFIGRGSEFQRLEKFCLSRKLKNVLFECEIPQEELEGLYRQCYAGIVSLDPKLRTNNIPGKFVSYMKAGLPVLANIYSDSDLADLIRTNKVGVVSEAGYLNELETSIQILIDEDGNDSCYSERCKRLFKEEFSIKSIVKIIMADAKGDNPYEFY